MRNRLLSIVLTGFLGLCFIPACVMQADNIGEGGNGTLDCVAGGACNCGANAKCNVECAGGGCNVNCGAGSTCDVSCKGGNCFVVCGEGATCNTCGTEASTTCGNNAHCDKDHC